MAGKDEDISTSEAARICGVDARTFRKHAPKLGLVAREVKVESRWSRRAVERAKKKIVRELGPGGARAHKRGEK